MSRLLAFVWGGLFALGLGIGRLAQPTTILGYLDVLGDWDPTLFIALCAGSSVHAAFHFGVTRLTRGAIRVSRQEPSTRKVDRSLVLGAALFGAGWGIAGMCPGAALTSAAYADGRPLVFLLAMAAGMLAHGPTRRMVTARWLPAPSSGQAERAG